MRVITFYSFKGGVGRSNLLYNIAYQLAARHSARVVIADADLHAPGLTCLSDLQDPDGHLVGQGLLDVLGELADAAESGDVDSEVTDPAGLVRPTYIGRRIHRGIEGNGDIWFLPAGAFAAGSKEDYSAKLQAMRGRLPKLVAKDKDKGKQELLDWLVGRIGARFENEPPAPDYVLFDARTGLTELGELLISNMPQHHIVVVFGLNDQNLEGMEHVLRGLVASLGPANIASRLVLVASPVPTGEEELKQRQKARALEIIGGVIREASEKAGVVPALLPFFMVPYHPIVALTETPMAEKYPDSEIVRAFTSVTEALRMRPLAVERVRTEVSLAVREQTPREKPRTLTGVSRGGEHPMARRLPWNVVLPEATPAAIWAKPPPRAEELLAVLANSYSTEEDRGSLLENTRRLSQAQIDELIGTYQRAEERFRQLSDEHWSTLAWMRGLTWARWALLSAAFLRVEAGQASKRLVEAWPFPLGGGVGARAVVGAVEKLSSVDGLPREEARRLLTRAGDANAVDAAALGSVGSAWIRIFGEVEAGNDHYRRALEIEPDSHEAENNWGNALSQRAGIVREKAPAEALTLLEAAESHYQRALEIEPDSHEAEYNWGTALSQRAEIVRKKAPTEALVLLEAAESHYHRVLELKADSHDAENNWGSTLMVRAGIIRERTPSEAVALLEAAESHYRRSLELKADMHDTENNWGNALLRRARIVLEKTPSEAVALLEAAESHYRRSLELKPDDYQVENNWGNALFERAGIVREKAPLEAVALLEAVESHCRRALELKPDYQEAEFNWGNVLVERAGIAREKAPLEAVALLEAAEAHYRRALELKPDDHEVENNWGTALLERARIVREKAPTEALTLLESADTHHRRAVELKPDNHGYLDDLVVVLLWKSHVLKALQRSEDAKTAVTGALAAARWVVEARGRKTYNLACALAQGGSLEEALSVLEELRANGELNDLDWLRRDLDMEPLRDHPRFLALLASPPLESESK